VKYGVKPKDIISILMWESGLGEFSGNHSTLKIYLGQILYMEQARDHALKSSANKAGFSIRDRKRFQKIKLRAVDNIAALLRMSKIKSIDPLLVRGSWGGAIGYVQFLPTNLKYAADGDNDGKIDLKSWPDAIFSVANYLHTLGKYDYSKKQRRKAIHTYNPSNSYVNGVILYADTMIKQVKNTRSQSIFTKEDIENERDKINKLVNNSKSDVEKSEAESTFHGKVKINKAACENCVLEIVETRKGITSGRFNSDNQGKYSVSLPIEPTFCVNVFYYSSGEKISVKKRQNYCTFSKKTRMNIKVSQ
jgi:hypothetical protein